MSSYKSSKVDQNGKYVMFCGYTVISFLKERHEDIWKDFFSWMKTLKTFNKYFSLLPVDSLHVTIKNHICMTDKNYNDFSSENITIKSAKLCKLMDVVPLCKITGMYALHSLGVYVDIINMEEVEKLRKMLVILGMKPEDNFKFHMTFAYKYKEVPDNEKKSLEQDLKEIYEKLKLFADNRVLNFEKATYCGFLSMTEYIPLKTSDL